LTVIESVSESEQEDRGLSVKVRSSEPFSFRWGSLDLPFASGDSEFLVGPKEVRLTRLNGSLGSGICTASASATLQGESSTIEAQLQFKEVDLAEVGRASRWLQPYSGQITGTLTIRQTNRKDAVVVGSIHLTQARFEEAPLFQPVVNRLRAIGLGEPSTVDLQFEAAGENVTVETLKLWSGGHSLSLTGSIGLLGGLIDLSGTVDEEALFARVTGTIESPDWQMGEPKK
jgi:hypothetical protein